MAARGQTHNKRARELAIKEKRERKKARREIAAQRAAGLLPPLEDVEEVEGVEGELGVEAPPVVSQEWIQ